MHLSFYFLKLTLKRKINQLSKNEACNGNIGKLFCFRESYLKCSTDHKEISVHCAFDCFLYPKKTKFHHSEVL